MVHVTDSHIIQNEKQESYRLDTEKVAKQELYDGFLATATNAKGLDISQVLDHYKHLYQVEHAFRSFKSYLETRPMCHWTDQRIEGHLYLCYLAYTTEQYLLNQLKNKGRSQTEGQLRKALNQMQKA